MNLYKLVTAKWLHRIPRWARIPLLILALLLVGGMAYVGFLLWFFTGIEV